MVKNRKYLIRQLANLQLDDRFSNLVPVNCDPATGKKIGVAGALSVVFAASDAVSGKRVAIKFFDPEFGGIQQLYRLAAFKREAEILQSLTGKDRCLQLIEPLREVRIPVTTDSGDQLELPCAYFVTEWLEANLKRVFEAQDQYQPLEKLLLFRDVALAVFALHHNGIHHRDIKADNLMVALRDARELVVAIDLGTAARLSSVAIGDSGVYSQPVGARAYAPLEAQCGLSGIRAIGKAADYYALGCLLYELFNIDRYFAQLLNNVEFQRCRARCEQHVLPLLGSADDPTLLVEWGKVIARSKRLVRLPGIDDPGSTVAPSIGPVLGRLLAQLTAIDHRERVNHADSVIRQLDSAIRALQNQLAERKRAEERNSRRQVRQEAALEKQERLKRYLVERERNGHS